MDSITKGGENEDDEQWKRDGAKEGVEGERGGGSRSRELVEFDRSTVWHRRLKNEK